MVISTCRVQGSVEAADKLKGVPCAARLSGEHPSEAQPVGVTGETFTYAIPVAGSEAPPLRASIILACEGYEDTPPCRSKCVRVGFAATRPNWARSPSRDNKGLPEVKRGITTRCSGRATARMEARR
jgi:hypothetical protein